MRSRTRLCNICRHTGLLAVCAVSAFSVSVRAAGNESRPVAIVLTPHTIYRAAATTIKDELTRAGHTCIIVELPHPTPPVSQPVDTKTADSKPKPPSPTEKALAKLIDAHPSIIVTVGVTATTQTLARVPDTPVVFCMVPNALDMPALAKDHPDRRRLTGVPTDLAPREYINWFKKLHPEIRTIGILHSDNSKRTAEAITIVAKTQGILIRSIKARRDEFIKAIDKLNEKKCQAVLMIPDARVYNSANAQRLLLWGLRQKKPVWAFSANIVKAGAFAGLYSDNEDIARQTALIVQKIMTGTKASSIGLQYSRAVRSAINERTADMIGISLSSSILDSFTERYGKPE